MHNNYTTKVLVSGALAPETKKMKKFSLEKNNEDITVDLCCLFNSFDSRIKKPGNLTLSSY